MSAPYLTHWPTLTADFSQVEPEQVVAVHDVPSTYRVPVHLEEQGLVSLLRDILQLDALTISEKLKEKGTLIWNSWKRLTNPSVLIQKTVKIALVGKYTNLHDSYLSVIKSLEHAAMACEHKLELIWVDASNLEQGRKKEKPADFHKAWHEVCTAQGILVPGGFGIRGTEGMIAAAQWARENGTPYLGICLGMQIAVIEFARNVCGISSAGSEELNENASDKIVLFMPEVDREKLGGTMRLGLRSTHFQKGSEWSKLRALYGNSLSKRVLVNGHAADPSSSAPSISADKEAPIILERHRHRYEVNPDYIDRLSQEGLNFIGKDDKGERMEILELNDHPWFVGVQFHPEYLSRVLEPSKPYLGFVAASAGCLPEILAKMKGSKVMNEVNGSSPDALVNGLGSLIM